MSAAILPILLLCGYLIFVWWLWREVGTAVARRSSAAAVEGERARMNPERVLFVCTHNSTRSQIAEALLRHIAGPRFLVASAGTEPTRIHPLAEEVMAERGLSLGGHRAKGLTEVGVRWDCVITVCDEAYERCPEFDSKTSRLHWSIEDPSRTAGGLPQQRDTFRRTRDELEQRVQRWVSERLERA